MVILIPDPWHLISNADTWHLISDTWYLILVLDMLSLNTWHLISDTWRLTCSHLIHGMLSLGTIHLTWCCDTSLDNIILDTVLHCIFMIITFTGTWHDCYTATRHLVLMNSCTPVFLNPLNRETPDIILLILYSCWSLKLGNHGYWITVNILWTLSLWTICNNWTTYTETGETDGYRGENWWVPI